MDNLSRRKIDIDLGGIPPIVSIGERLKAWEEIGGKPMRFSTWTSPTNINGFSTSYSKKARFGGALR